jgi:hypothetical protein
LAEKVKALRTYTVHRKAELLRPEDLETRQGVLFIKDGIAWLAVFAPLIWLLWYRLWIWALVYIGAVAIVGLVGYAASFPENLTTYIVLLLNFLVGLEANNLRRAGLQKHGFHESADIVAENLDEATYRYFASHLSQQNG